MTIRIPENIKYVRERRNFSPMKISGFITLSSENKLNT